MARMRLSDEDLEVIYSALKSHERELAKRIGWTGKYFGSEYVKATHKEDIHQFRITRRLLKRVRNIDKTRIKNIKGGAARAFQISHA